MGIRVPLMTGFPERISGSVVMRSSLGVIMFRCPYGNVIATGASSI
jgi:hypothetical protein